MSWAGSACGGKRKLRLPAARDIEASHVVLHPGASGPPETATV